MHFILYIAGPSGIGKSELIKKLKKEFPQIYCHKDRISNYYQKQINFKDLNTFQQQKILLNQYIDDLYFIIKRKAKDNPVIIDAHPFTTWLWSTNDVKDRSQLKTLHSLYIHWKKITEVYPNVKTLYLRDDNQSFDLNRISRDRSWETSSFNELLINHNQLVNNLHSIDPSVPTKTIDDYRWQDESKWKEIVKWIKSLL